MTGRASALVASIAVILGCRPVGGLGEGVLYVTSGRGDQVIRLSPEDGRVLDSLPIDPRPMDVDEPHAIAEDPTGRYWYATLSHGDPTLWKFARPGDRLVGRVRLGMSGAARIGITPDGERAFIPDYYRDGAGDASEVAVVRLHDLDVTARLPICPGPHHAEVSPDGNLVAIACPLSDEIVLLDPETLAEVRRIKVVREGDGHGHPMNLAWTPAGTVLYGALMHAGAVVGWDTVGVEVARVAVGAGPAQLAVSSDGMTLVVANRGDRSVSLIDVAAGAERIRVPVAGEHPHSVAIGPDGRLAFVTYEGTTESPGGVVAVRLEDGEVIWRTPVGTYTLGVMYLAGVP